MSDSTPLIEQIASAQAGKEITANALFDAGSVATSYGRHAEACAGLTWGYYGTRYGGAEIANDTHLCDASTTTYMVVDLTTGAVTFDTDDLNWLATETWGRAYLIVASTNAITSYEDHRFGPGGIFWAGSGQWLGGNIDGGRAASVYDQSTT